MKKLLTIFSSISLITMTSGTAIACSNNNEKEDKKSDITSTSENKESKEMDKNQNSSSTSTNMNNTQGSNPPAATNMVTQPKNETFWKEEPLIFSEIDYVSQYFKRKEHIKKTSELVLENSEGIKERMQNSIPETTNRDPLAETQDLILENSNSLMNSTR
ncbi:lipoprotein [Mycoplasma mycoides subsp. capri]|uniref:lipoprotein n=1 Tax=Mycoplasma mycoides TaxID=2102 RepID=UPI00223F2F03|nr:lipoprotein [Mycoplasma mycoides]UZK64352.1 lipoprotein [Mycoplasma mycoides subsp. capri]